MADGLCSPDDGKTVANSSRNQRLKSEENLLKYENRENVINLECANKKISLDKTQKIDEKRIQKNSEIDYSENSSNNNMSITATSTAEILLSSSSSIFASAAAAVTTTATTTTTTTLSPTSSSSLPLMSIEKTTIPTRKSSSSASASTIKTETSKAKVLTDTVVGALTAPSEQKSLERKNPKSNFSAQVQENRDKNREFEKQDNSSSFSNVTANLLNINNKSALKMSTEAVLKNGEKIIINDNSSNSNSDGSDGKSNSIENEENGMKNTISIKSLSEKSDHHRRHPENDDDVDNSEVKKIDSKNETNSELNNSSFEKDIKNCDLIITKKTAANTTNVKSNNNKMVKETSSGSASLAMNTSQNSTTNNNHNHNHNHNNTDSSEINNCNNNTNHNNNNNNNNNNNSENSGNSVVLKRKNVPTSTNHGLFPPEIVDLSKKRSKMNSITDNKNNGKNSKTINGGGRKDSSNGGDSVDPDSGTDESRTKKKRCSDRYDSSESSDSGVATLSCTDSSTASSDASDPGSPYSPASLGDDSVNHQSSTKNTNMPPQTILATQLKHSSQQQQQQQQQQEQKESNKTSIENQQNQCNLQTAQHQQQQQQSQQSHKLQQWPWNAISNNANLLSNNSNNHNNNNNNYSAANKNNVSNLNSNSTLNSSKIKRQISATNLNDPLSVSVTTNCSGAKKARSSNNNNHNNNNINNATNHNSNNCAEKNQSTVPSAAKRLKLATINDSQKKITGYFKAQMKPQNSSLKKDAIFGINGNSNNNSNCSKSLTVADQNLQNISSTPQSNSTTGGLNKYFNILSKNNKDEQKDQKISTKMNPVEDNKPTSTVAPSLKRIERRTTGTAKVAQVAPISRKTAATISQPKSPKKPIAIAPRMTEFKKSTASSNPTLAEAIRKQSTLLQQQFDHNQAKMNTQPTVLLTAIRIPQPSPVLSQQQQQQSLQHHVQNHPQSLGKNQQHHQSLVSVASSVTTSPTTATATGKIGSVFQIPVMPNLVQIPNILATSNSANLLMNNGQLARISNAGAAAQYFLNGAVFKLQQFGAAGTGTSNIALTGSNNGNIGAVTGVPSIATSIPTTMVTNSNNSNHQHHHHHHLGTNGVLTMESATLPNGNILVKPPNITGQSVSLNVAVTSTSASTSYSTTKTTLPLTQAHGTSISETVNLCSQAQHSFTSSGQRITAQPVFMATAAGLLLNAASLPAAAVITTSPKHPPGLTSAIPALHPIQQPIVSQASGVLNSSNLNAILHQQQMMQSGNASGAGTTLPNSKEQTKSTIGALKTIKTSNNCPPPPIPILMNHADSILNNIPQSSLITCSTTPSVSTTPKLTVANIAAGTIQNIISPTFCNTNNIPVPPLVTLTTKRHSPPPMSALIASKTDVTTTKSLNITTVSNAYSNSNNNCNKDKDPLMIPPLLSFPHSPSPSLSEIRESLVVDTAAFSEDSCPLKDDDSDDDADPDEDDKADSENLSITPPPLSENLPDTNTLFDMLKNNTPLSSPSMVKEEKLLSPLSSSLEKKSLKILQKSSKEEFKLRFPSSPKCSLPMDKIKEKISPNVFIDDDEEQSKTEEICNSTKATINNIISALSSSSSSSSLSSSSSSLTVTPPLSNSPSSISLINCDDIKSGSTENSSSGILEESISSLSNNSASQSTPTAVQLPKSAISPILSQPKTIRFPALSGEAGCRFGPKGAKRHHHDGVCYWDNCNEKYDTSSKLLDHLQTQHANSQTGPFTCLWSGCKVHGRQSCSRRWLERHVLSHGGTKPFKCIVDGCGLRFGSQLALQKHVNGHFNATETKDSQNKRTSDPPVPKLLRKNGKKLRYRRQPFSARMFDFFDSGVMEGLQHRLIVTGSLVNGPKGSITFQGKPIACRKTSEGASEILVRWSPNDIIPDEWIPENEATAKKVVPVHSLKCNELIALEKCLGAGNHKSDISTILNGDEHNSSNYKINDNRNTTFMLFKNMLNNQNNNRNYNNNNTTKSNNNNNSNMMMNSMKRFATAAVTTVTAQTVSAISSRISATTKSTFGVTSDRKHPRKPPKRTQPS